MTRAPFLLSSLLLCACAQPEVPRAPRACTQIANSFVLVASQRERGATLEAQRAVAREAAGSEAGLAHWLRVIDLVYRYEDASPREIGSTVLDHCTLDERGRASITTLWPTGSSGPSEPGHRNAGTSAEAEATAPVSAGPP